MFRDWLGNKWQDAILALGSIVFAVSLLPTVLGPEKPAVLTCFLTAATLSAYSAVYVSLRLWVTLVFASITVSLWWILFFQVV